MCNLAPNGIVTWNLVKTKVINEETRRLVERDSSSSKSKVLVIESWGRSKSRGLKKGRAKSRSKSRGRNAEIECHYCHNTGHKKWQCRKWKKEKGKKKQQQEHKQDSELTVMLAVLLQLLRGL